MPYFEDEEIYKCFNCGNKLSAKQFLNGKSWATKKRKYNKHTYDDYLDIDEEFNF